jgi:hypothetical protein
MRSNNVGVTQVTASEVNTMSQCGYMTSVKAGSLCFSHPAVSRFVLPINPPVTLHFLMPVPLISGDM